MIQKALEFEIWKANKAEAKNAQTYSLYLTEGDSFSKACLKNLKQQVGQNITFSWGKPVGNQAGHNVIQVYITDYNHYQIHAYPPLIPHVKYRIITFKAKQGNKYLWRFPQFVQYHPSVSYASCK